jgi:excisionase family DNA binding protein
MAFPFSSTVPEAAFSSVPEAARHFKVSKLFLYRLIKAGKVPHYRFSARSIRVDLKELQAVFHCEKAA